MCIELHVDANVIGNNIVAKIKVIPQLYLVKIDIPAYGFVQHYQRMIVCVFPTTKHPARW